MLKIWLKLALAGTAMLCIGTAVAQINAATVTGGRVEGVVSDGVASFKGIPFAAPPVGELRWKAPQPLAAWTGTRKADTYGPSCMQDPTFARIFDAPPAIGEDCLYLNVWTPAKSPSEKLPVMVWIYGGGFVGGMTSVPSYDGTHLAQQGVILVSVAYRLGVFGFLAHPGLSAETGKGSGNYGLLDQIAALKWVKANIAAFGGDPARVTIFGESAGGLSVSMLAASPRARGLFHGVISESGGSFGPPRYANEGGESVPPLKVAEASGKAFLDKLGAHDIKAARALNAEVIQKALGAGLQGGFWPVFDGDVLPGDQYKLYQAGRFNDTNVLIGTNSDEGSLFVTKTVTPAAFEQQVREGYGAGADAILAASPHATDAEATRAARNLARDSTFAWHTWAWALLQSQKGKGKAYLYYFDHRTPRTPNGSGHGSEIGYVFRNLGGPGAGPSGIQGTPTAEDHAISDLLSGYWVNFAKTGNPNGPGLPQWSAFSASHQQALVADPHPGTRAVPNMDQLKALDAYYAWRRTQEH
ncbi:MAG TPA: carboxylesterase/lipase family protein [Steroidobacteraceae bacterium]|nr:carboxylesterase/lipase family protein [Steroidobacteraceae bacterium]